MALKKGIPPSPRRIYPEVMYTLEELAGVLRCGLHTIYNYRLQGRFKYVQRGAKGYLVSGKEVNYLKANGLRPVTESYRKAAAASQRSYRERRRAREAVKRG